MENFLIALIILLQLYFFVLTLSKINLLKTVFSEPEQYRILRVVLLSSDLESTAPLVILKQLTQYELRATDADPDTRVSVALLMPYNRNVVAGVIVNSINTYLLRNSGAVSDFNLIKDIAERNSDALDEEINNTVSLPLYLGLLGTLLGIVFGLSRISGLSFEGTADASGTLLDHAIPLLLNGVKVAMIASFTGLFFTVIHSGIYYRRAKMISERRKNSFFTFIQIELLPLLNDNLNTALYSLQANLQTFNRDFGQNVMRLDGLMNKNYDALMAQEQFMDTLSKIDIAEFAGANVKVLNSLQKTVRSFEELTHYASAVNMAIRKTDTIVEGLNGFLERTDNLNAMVLNLMHVFEQNQDLMEFLSSHFTALDDSKQLIGSSVVSVSDYLGKAIDELKLFTEEKIAAVRTIEVNEASLMRDTYPEKWKNLDELKKINLVIAALSESHEVTVRELRAAATALYEVNATVGKLEKGIIVRLKVPSIRKIVKGLFQKEMAHEKV